MYKTLLFIAMASLLIKQQALGQEMQDTIIVKLASSSQITFTISDRKDIEVLKHYDFQELFDDIIERIETEETAEMEVEEEEMVVQEESESQESEEAYEELENELERELDKDTWKLRGSEEEDSDEDEDEDNKENREWKYLGSRTWHTVNFDLGTNNYLSNGEFPSSSNAAYAVRPWGSWYVGVNSVNRTRLMRHLFLEWGFGISWYNFKFEQNDILITKDDNGITFAPDPRDLSFHKSKLTISTINANLVPVFDLSEKGSKSRIWDGHRSGFRFGVGPYVGYRIGSHSKLVYSDGGKERDKNKDSFYLENFRYGLRMQIGFKGTDLFFNYDMNNLFSPDKGPELNAFSFGITL